MLRIAGKTAGPFGTTFFVDTHGWPGGCYKLKIRHFFLKFFLFLFIVFHEPFS